MANKCDVRKISELTEENQVSDIVFYVRLLLMHQQMKTRDARYVTIYRDTY